MSPFVGAAVNGLRELWANRTRSLLSMSGVVLGVMAIATMLAVAEGMLTGFRGFVEASGGVERIVISPAAPPKEQERLRHLSDGLTLRDAETTLRATPFPVLVSPELRLGELTVARGGRRVNASLVGCGPDFTAVNLRSVAAGRFVCDLDQRDRTDVCVLGSSVAEALFSKNESPVGKTVTVGGMRFTVVGLLERFGAKSAEGRTGALARVENAAMCIPLRTAMTRFTGDTRLTGIAVRVEDRDLVPQAGETLDNLLLRAHRGLRDFRVETNESTLENFQKTERTFVIALAAVTLIALLVGGAGIMNVMLASIHERTHEIGVRLALGARGSDIFAQFLIESAVVGAIGGVLGTAGAFAILSSISSIIAGSLSDAAPAHLSQGVMLVSVGFSCTLGLAAGILPALRASRLDPVKALRAE